MKKRHFASDKIIIGIDPARRKHQVAVLNFCGIPYGDSFMIKNAYHGYHRELWQKLDKVGLKVNGQNTICAIEISCNLWQTLAHYL